MKFDLVLKEEAEEEVVSAYQWYENEQVGLGEAFLANLDKCFRRLTSHPKGFPKVYQRQRQALLDRFPFVVIYEVEGSEIIVYAVFHTSRDPRRKFRKLNP